MVIGKAYIYVPMWSFQNGIEKSISINFMLDIGCRPIIVTKLITTPRLSLYIHTR